VTCSELVNSHVFHAWATEPTTGFSQLTRTTTRLAHSAISNHTHHLEKEIGRVQRCLPRLIEHRGNLANIAAD
jgi:hypothetical protein